MTRGVSALSDCRSLSIVFFSRFAKYFLEWSYIILPWISGRKADTTFMMIVAAALHSKCTTIYTEDIQDGANIMGVTIKNPF
jgi:hypothetical protein